MEKARKAEADPGLFVCFRALTRVGPPFATCLGMNRNPVKRPNGGLSVVVQPSQSAVTKNLLLLSFVMGDEGGDVYALTRTEARALAQALNEVADEKV